jgi:hypothetical protein
MKPLRILALALTGGLLLNVSCSSSDDGSGTNSDAATGGPVTGPAGDHCAGNAMTVDATTCSGDPSAGGAADDGAGRNSSSSSGGASDCDQTHDAAYGDTLFNAEGDDDDCKYHASWSSTPIRLNEPVTFTLTVANKTTNMPLVPLADGDVPLRRLDVYQPCDPNRRGPAQNLSAKITQVMDGQFSAGPIKFDHPGRWVVRFHLYEQCVDSETSPHGHIAFFIDVP